MPHPEHVIPMMNRIDPKRRLTCSAAVALFVLAVWALNRSALSLIQQATLVGKLNSDGEIPVHPEWINDHEAMFIRYFRDGHRFEFTKLDADTGKHTSMNGLNAEFALYLQPRGSISEDRDAGPCTTPLRFSLSPSRQRLLLCMALDYNGVSSCDFGFETDLAGRSHHTWKRNPADRYLWLPLWFSGGQILDVVDADLAANSISVFNPAQPVAAYKFPNLTSPPVYWLNQYFTRETQIWTFSLPTRGSRIKVIICDLAGKTPSRTLTLDPPTAGELREVCLSPDGEHLAWLFVDYYKPALSKFLHRLYSRFHDDPAKRYSIYVSDIAGSHMWEVGEEQHDHASGDEIGIESIAWLPSGKSISFNCAGGLYSIPVYHWHFGW